MDGGAAARSALLRDEFPSALVVRIAVGVMQVAFWRVPASVWVLACSTGGAMCLLHAWLLRRYAAALQALPVLSLQEAADQLWVAWRARGESSTFVQIRGLMVDDQGWFKAVRQSTHGAPTLNTGCDAADVYEIYDRVDLLPLNPRAFDAFDPVMTRWEEEVTTLMSKGRGLFLRACQTAARPWCDWLRGFRTIRRLDVAPGAERIDNVVDCQVDVVSFHGRLALRSVTRWALVKGAGLTACGRLELCLRGPFNYLLGFSTLEQALLQGRVWDMLPFSEDARRVALRALLRAVPAPFMHVRLTACDTEGEAPLLAAPAWAANFGPLFSPALWNQASKFWGQLFTPGHLFLTPGHPKELVYHLQQHAAQSLKAGVWLLGLSVVAAIASRPGLVLLWHRRRQMRLLLHQRQAQAIAQEAERERVRAREEERARHLVEIPQRPRDEAVAHHSSSEGGGSSRDRRIDDEGIEGSEMDHHACLVCCEAWRSTVLPCRHQLLCSVCVARLNPARKLSQCSDRSENLFATRAIFSLTPH